MAFAENIKKCREEKGLSQTELANQVHIAQSMIA
jgi:ribosome-binding protein aMBF1 (putative translation factor)